MIFIAAKTGSIVALVALIMSAAGLRICDIDMMKCYQFIWYKASQQTQPGPNNHYNIITLAGGYQLLWCSIGKNIYLKKIKLCSDRAI